MDDNFISLRRAFSYVLFVEEQRLQVENYRGVLDYKYRNEDDYWAPTREDLEALILSDCRRTIFYDGSASNSGKQLLPSSSLSVLNAHFLILKLLQQGKIRAKGNIEIIDYKNSKNENTGLSKENHNNILSPNIWRSGLWSSFDNNLLPINEAGLVPNYLESKIDPFVSVKEFLSFTYSDIEVDVNRLVNEINYYRDTSSSCAGSGIFKKFNNKIELTYGGKTVMLENTTGTQSIRVLLSLPKVSIYYPVLYNIAKLLKDGRDLDKTVFSDAQKTVSRERNEFFNKNNMDSFYRKDDEDRLKHLINMEKKFKGKTKNTHTTGIPDYNLQHIRTEINEIRNSLKRREAFYKSHRENLTHTIKTSIKHIDSLFPEISEHFGKLDKNSSIYSINQGYIYSPNTIIKWDTGSNYSRNVETSDVQEKAAQQCNDNGFIIIENEPHQQKSKNYDEWNPDDNDSFDPRSDTE